MANVNGDSESELPVVKILYEDNDLLVVDKPAGLVVHADGRTKESTLTDWVLKKFPALKDVGGMHTLDSGRYAPRAGILHRLDRETSGVILIAKNDGTFYFLQRQFLDHSIEKTYNAFVVGELEKKEGVIDLSIGRSRSDFRQWSTGDDARGTLRKATTAYRVLQRGGGFSLLELKPTTGRTHQLRVHLKALGHPIVCDKRYGSVCALGFTRLALHAGELVIEYPKGKKLVLTAPPPEDFVHAPRTRPPITS
ncbi:MAG: RluA family pseudouridine synthase [Candidatus Uhrbacteria bacterium]|nr:RluA family pseudouridine synthase [Candidatus Uhrbacteria bacterium]